MTEITVDEWEAEIERLTAAELKEEDGWITAVALAKRLGRSRSTAARILRQGVDDGRYEMQRGPRTDSSGRMQMMSCYRVLK